jgi:pSer/pThr/pTyr-binding forkhead associated (FHA) protein
MSACPACGAEVELGRLTGILGIVCRACDAYNEPGARTCAACGKALGEATPTATAAPPATPGGAPPAPGSPVVHAFAKPASGAATRVVPAMLRPSAPKPPPSEPAVTPVPLLGACPGCGAAAGSGRFCARCGHALGPRGTQVVMKSIPQPPRGASPRARLVLEAGAGFEGATFRLDGDAVEAGRSKGAVAFPDDDCLAAHHATFLHRDGKLFVRDEGAPGGVFVRLRAPATLRPGDQFAVGERLLRYAGPLPAPPAPLPDGTRRLGATRPPAPAIVIEEWLEGGAPGRVFVRGGGAVTIGRSGCAVSLGDDPRLSPTHAELAVDAAGAARLRDLGSATGTFVKLPARAERALQDGDRVRLGREVLRVTFP